MQTDSSIQSSLKEAAQLSSAVWAVLAERVGGAWLLRAVYHINDSTAKRVVPSSKPKKFNILSACSEKTPNTNNPH